MPLSFSIGLSTVDDKVTPYADLIRLQQGRVVFIHPRDTDGLTNNCTHLDEQLPFTGVNFKNTNENTSMLPHSHSN